MTKSIWYFHHYAGTPSRGMAYRPYYLSREFNRQGHRACVIAADYHHLMQHHGEFDTPLHHAIEDEVPYIWLKACSYQGNHLSRIRNMLQYSFKSWWYHKKISKWAGKPDVIIASSPHLFHIVSAYRIAKKYKAQFVVEVRDIWPLSLTQLSSIKETHPLIRVLSLKVITSGATTA